MKPDFLIYDETGEDGQRSQRLEAIIKSKRFTVNCGTPVESTTETICLCHASDIKSETQYAILKSLVATGKVVVVYTDGATISRDDGGVHHRSLTAIEQLLGWACDDWTREEFAALLDEEWAKTRRSGFAVLAILAQCASVAVADIPGAEKRQHVWQTDPEHWRRLLVTIPLALLKDTAERENMREAARLISWIIAGGEVPDFAKAWLQAAGLSC
jgi:hypothetical protein